MSKYTEEDYIYSEEEYYECEEYTEEEYPEEYVYTEENRKEDDLKEEERRKEKLTHKEGDFEYSYLNVMCKVCSQPLGMVDGDLDPKCRTCSWGFGFDYTPCYGCGYLLGSREDSLFCRNCLSLRVRGESSATCMFCSDLPTSGTGCCSGCLIEPLSAAPKPCNRK